MNMKKKFLLSLIIMAAFGWQCQNSKPEANDTGDSLSLRGLTIDPKSSEAYLLQTSDFEILFPAEPIHSADTIQLTNTLAAVSHKYLLDLGSQVYAIIYIDYPGQVQTQAILNEAKRGVLSSFYNEPEIRKDSSIQLAEQPGIDFFVGSPSEALFLHYRLLMVGQRLYQIVVSSDHDFVGEEQVYRYFNSFRLKPASQ